MCIIENVKRELIDNVDRKTKNTSQNFFKEKINSYGVRIPIVNKIAKDNFKLIQDKTKTEIYTYCEQLWKSGNFEESIIACNWSINMKDQFEKKDFILFEKWINNYINNWASCDTFCNHTIGEFIELYPNYISKLKEFTKSKNLWTRRAAAVSLIVPAKKGLFVKDIFEIADLLLLDKEDLVQKGYGWMLKVTSQTYQKEVFDYVIKNKKIMPRTALRYAIEKMPDSLRKEAMKK